jgi:hypothetical protein
MVTELKPREFEAHNYGAQFPFETVTEPGAYISNWSGHLMRIPEEALKPGHSPMIVIRGKEPIVVTKLSDDPFITINKARMIAADLDLVVNF